eukprot:911489-Pyramimonas_sp.AAC.2
MGRLKRAWRVPVDIWQDRSPGWQGVRGPTAATWLSLRRAGWETLRSAVILSDEGLAISLLQVAPRDVRKLLRPGVQRWQGRRVLKHRAEHLEGGETAWARALTLTVGGKAATIKSAQVISWCYSLSVVWRIHDRGDKAPTRIASLSTLNVELDKTSGTWATCST